MIKLLVLSIMFAGTAIAADQTFDYKIRSHSVSVADCHQEVRNIGVRFNEVTGAEVVFARCESSGEYGIDLLIRYKAEEELNLVTTDVYSSVIDETFMYESKESCEAALSDEVNYFKEATGLEVVVSYCFSKWMRDPKNWMARVDSFGTPSIRPVYSSLHFSGTPENMSRDELLAVIGAGLENYGVDVRNMNYTPSFGFTKITAFYYWNARIDLEADEVARVQDYETCEAELAIANELFSSNDPLNSIFNYCSRNYLRPSVYDVVRVRIEESQLEQFSAVEAFESYGACASERNGLIGYYNSELGYNVKGALCSLKDNTWRLEMFE